MTDISSTNPDAITDVPYTSAPPPSSSTSTTDSSTSSSTTSATSSDTTTDSTTEEEEPLSKKDQAIVNMFSNSPYLAPMADDLTADQIDEGCKIAGMSNSKQKEDKESTEAKTESSLGTDEDTSKTSGGAGGL